MATKDTNYPSKDHVYILPDKVLLSKTVQLSQLRNPRTERGCLFLLDFDNKGLYEILAYNEKYRSWLIGDCIISDGSIRIATICDPVFLILPYLLKAFIAKKNLPLDHLLEDAEYPQMLQLCEFVKDLYCVADMKGSQDLNVWCYNEASTLSWLEKKTKNLSDLLQRKRERISLGFSVSLNSSVEDKEAYLNLAFGILSEYLCEELCSKLRTHLKLPEVDKENLNLSFKKAKPLTGDKEETSNKSTSASKAKCTESAKQKALSKSAKGTKSITSFFTKL